jgi:hypothetical protein
MSNGASVAVHFPASPEPVREPDAGVVQEGPAQLVESSVTPPSFIQPPTELPVAPPLPIAAPLELVQVDRTRRITTHTIAIVLVVSFLLIASLPMFVMFSGSDPMDNKIRNAVEWLKGVSAFLAGIVGAVIGYYYRDIQSNQ